MHRYVWNFDEAIEDADVTLRLFGLEVPTAPLGAFSMTLLKDKVTLAVGETVILLTLSLHHY